MFETLEAAAPDPILGLSEAFRNDPNPNKINLGVGVFKDASGVTPVLKCVKAAEQTLVDQEDSKSYLGIDGLPAYQQAVQSLLFGGDHEIVTSGRAATVQSPGGTGALRIAGDFMKRKYPGGKIWLSKPTWANHAKIFQAAGMSVAEYSYLDKSQRGIDFAALMADLKNIPAGNMVVLHGCCHNPSGVDLSVDQWKEVATCVKQQGLLPLVDFAYQGFGSGLQEDAAGLHALCAEVDELFVASSFSKNFGLYRERVGALTVVTPKKEIAQAVLSHLKLCVRTNYSNPPSHGASIVKTVLENDEHRKCWQDELAEMRNRINGMRDLFVSTMAAQGVDHDFSFIQQQRGMFSFSGLSKEQVEKLRNDHSIYIVGSGRINVAGINPDNVGQLCQAIAQVL